MEIRFYHLTRTTLEAALPQMLEKTLERGQRAVVQAGSAARVEALTAWLWTYQDRSFLPHGSAKDGHGALQPVWLTDQDERPNGAQVLFLTDGLPSVGEQDPERIAQQAESARGRTRLFAFGVGYDVNTYLLDRLTAAGRGATEYVEPTEDVEQAVGTLAAKIQHPVLTDLELGNAPVRLTEIYPLQLPDLFSGEELIVFGRYEAIDQDRRGTLAMRGQRKLVPN